MKNQIKILAILGVLLFGFLGFTTIDKRVIIIDAGHGGHDYGATINGIQEKIISESIAQKIKTLNKDSNTEIVLLREGDHFMELSERTSTINNLKPELVVSLHVGTNSNATANGVEVYVSSKNKTFNERSKMLAENVIEKIASTGNLTKRKVSEAPFYILKNTECPAILVEMGYLSNEKDRNYITSESGQTEIAEKILESLK
ncbi:N-acetylmuramoyl-L-alanine amidase [Flavobacterium artemisiae]|uniref:N-acetylmuramoyl-L-alanine amidase n=1 Tax=Flavobacterium artemisiae TaxID=2126556 RepID=A0ABW4HD59_9FLAO